jgi:hypothetical protein
MLAGVSLTEVEVVMLNRERGAGEVEAAPFMQPGEPANADDHAARLLPPGLRARYLAHQSTAIN